MTIPEPSPLPRFGIRHLLGLTAALAVASVLLRGAVLEAFSTESTGATVGLPQTYSISMIIVVANLAINLFIVGCLLIWAWKLRGWKHEPGHFLAWTALIGGMSYAVWRLVSNLIGPDWQGVASIAHFCLSAFSSGAIYVFAVRRAEHKRWRLVFIVFFAIAACTLLSQFVVCLMQADYFYLQFLLAILSYLSYGLLALVTILLLSAIAIDLRTKTNRHWSHWWAANVNLVSYFFSIATVTELLLWM